MSLIKEIKIDQITVDENMNVFVREVTKIIENGVEISRSYHRTSLEKNADISLQPKQVQDICNVAWK